MSTVAYDKKEWKSLPRASLTDLWLFDSRSSEIELDYEPLKGGFIPAVPKWLMMRFTKPGWVVYDPFAGAMTTSRVGDQIARDVISLDIKCRGDSIEDPMYHHLGIGNARTHNPGLVDMIIAHPPYLSAIKFTDESGDLSTMDVDDYWRAMRDCILNFDTFLKPNRVCAFVMGSIYKDRQVVPLPAILYNMISLLVSNGDLKWLFKGWVTKNIEGNRQGETGLWLYRSCAADSFLFKTEAILVYLKEDK